MGPASVRKHRAALLATGLVVLCGWGFSLTGAVFASTRLVPEQYATIQAAVDASVSGDVVLLSPGTYTGDGNRAIDFRGQDLVLTSVAGPEQTIIDCEHVARGFYLHSYETRAARIERITVRNGYASMHVPCIGAGGGICCRVSNPTISDCVIENCSSDAVGGGVYLFSDGLLQRCMIRGNYSDQGGGIAETYGAAAIEDCVITDNLAGQGGGITFNGAGANTLKGCTISANFAGEGGGVWTGNRAFLDECIVWGNWTLFGDSNDIMVTGMGADVRCCNIDTTGVSEPTSTSITYDEFCVYTEPRFCNSYPGDWTLWNDSPCLPEHSPCGQLIGALGQGCNGPTPTRVTSWGRIKAAYR